MRHQLHISHLLLLGKCGVKYDFKYIQGRREPGRTAPFVGTVAHNAARFTLRRKIETGRLPSVEEVADVARDTFNEGWDAEEIAFTEDERKQGRAKAKGASLDLAVKLSTLHAKELAP